MEQGITIQFVLRDNTQMVWLPQLAGLSQPQKIIVPRITMILLTRQ